MAKPRNIKEFSELTGCSVSTVSRAFAHDPRVRAKTVERILALAKEHGFRPNLIAQTPFNGKSRSIGVMLWRLSNSFFADIALGINNGVATCHFNPSNLPYSDNLIPTYKIEKLTDLLNII